MTDDLGGKKTAIDKNNDSYSGSEFNFKKLSLENLGEIAPILKNHPSMLCDYSSLALYMWADYFLNEYCFVFNSLILRSKTVDKQGICYSYPIGGDLDAAFGALVDFAKRTHGYFKLFPVEEGELDSFRQRGFRVSESGWFDYVYNASDLALLSGKKYSGQRNHIKNFQRKYKDWQVFEISAQNAHTLVEFMLENGDEEASLMSQYESQKVIEVLKNFDAFDCFGVALKANGKVCGFSIGETKGEVCFQHIEKASREVVGAYPFLDNQFAKCALQKFPQIKYINKEEDVGLMGLRRSKESYHPALRLHKHEAVID